MTSLFRTIQRVESVILAFSILAIAALILLNIVCRSFFGFSLAATGELSQFLIIAVTFTGLSHAAGQGRHIRMTALFDQLSAPVRRRLMVCIAFVTALILLFLAWHALRYTLTVRRLGSVSPVLQVPLYLVYLIAPIGLALAAIQYVLTGVRNLRSDRVFLSWIAEDRYVQPPPGEA